VLTHLLNQKNLCDRQACWIEKISLFDLEVLYIPGTENMVADALSWMYSNDVPGIIHVHSKCMYHAVGDGDFEVSGDLRIRTGLEVRAAAHRRPGKIITRTETGRSKTSRGFVAHMHDNFVLRGPVERKEGEGTSQNRENPKTLSLYKPWLTIQIKPTVVENASLPEMEGVASTSGRSNTVLADVVPSTQECIDLLSELHKNYDKDPIFDLMLKKPSEYRNYEVENGLVYLKEKESQLMCIPKVLISGCSAREIVISEAHSLLDHPGVNKMLYCLRDQCWWKDIVSDAKSFCETCMTCKCSKPCQKLYALPNPLLIPGNPCKSIGMDFFGPLHESSNRDGAYHSIMVIICLLRYSIQPDHPNPLAS
jgi:hypothetical protein